MLPRPRGMLDRKDDNFLSRLINRVVNEVRILPGDQLTHAFNGLCSAKPRKQNQILERLENSGAHSPSGGWAVRANVVCNGDDVLCRSRREPELHQSKRRNAASISSSVANWRRFA